MPLRGNETTELDRVQTDQSLATEREKTDAAVDKKRDSLEVQADEVLRVARARADEVKLAERESGLTPSATAVTERRHEDLVVERERALADGLLAKERLQRKRSHEDFLAVERDATDQDLVDERSQADAVIAARDEFLATVSHDLRGYLNGLSMSAQLLSREAPEGPSGDKVRRFAETNRKLVTRMNRLINDLLDISSIEAGKLSVVRRPVEVEQILRDTVEGFEPIAAAKGVSLTASQKTVGLHALLDAERLLQVLANLVSNAIKFTPKGGQIVVSAAREGSEIRFAVRDTGIGIPGPALLGVFDRFRQVNKDRRGLGLGLHISKSIIETHGGRLWVESVVGSGSTFYVALPAEGAAA